MQITADNQVELLAWAAGILNCHFGVDSKAIGVMQSCDISAVVVYEDFTAYDCRIHVASNGSRRWLSRSFLCEIFHYPFVQCGLRRVTGFVNETNTDALRLDLRIGFKIEGRLRDATPDGDVLVLGQLRSECPFIPKEARYGQK